MGEKVDAYVVGRRIGAYLKLTGRKLGWFAEQMGWNNEKASMITNGKRQISLMDFFKVCKVLNVPYEQFISENDLIV
jgi:transcriptional regulator with XRE-family HTH domain